VIADPTTPSDDIGLTRIDTKIDGAVGDLHRHLDEERALLMSVGRVTQPATRSSYYDSGDGACCGTRIAFCAARERRNYPPGSATAGGHARSRGRPPRSIDQSHLCRRNWPTDRRLQSDGRAIAS